MIVDKQLSGLLLILLGSFGTCLEGERNATTTSKSSNTSTSHNEPPAPTVANDPPLIPVTNGSVPKTSPAESSQKANSEIKDSTYTVPSGEERVKNIKDNDVKNRTDLNLVLSNDNVSNETLEMATDKLENDPRLDFSDKNKVSTKQTTGLVSNMITEGSDSDSLESSKVVTNKTVIKTQNKNVKTSTSGSKVVSNVQEKNNNSAIFFAFLEPMFVVPHEPVYVNLTGIKDHSGHQRTITAGCLDLSGLQLTGKEVKEVIRRMSRHQFYRVDLSNNNISEVPANTFSPVAFMVQELRLDGNPLLSKDDDEGFSLLRSGGLFHLPELRRLNLSNCGLRDIDLLMPWNSDFLEILDLSGNKLSAVPDNLQFFHKLKRLYLVDNPIAEVEELPFALLWNMQVLDFTGCNVTAINGDPFKNMGNLKEVSFMDNQLSRISNLRFPLSWRLRLYLSGNSWHCDIDFLNFIETHYDYIYDFDYIRCSSPWWLKDMHAAFLSEEIVSLDKSSQPVLLDTRRDSQQQFIPLITDRLQLLYLTIFVLSIIALLTHLLCAKRRDQMMLNTPEIGNGVAYISIDKKPLSK